MGNAPKRTHKIGMGYNSCTDQGIAHDIHKLIRSGYYTFLPHPESETLVILSGSIDHVVLGSIYGKNDTKATPTCGVQAILGHHQLCILVNL